MKKQHTELLFVQITPECNMGCRYCPFSNQNIFTNRQNNFVAQIQSIKKTFDSKSFTESSLNELIVYGGEALLYLDQVKRIINEYKNFRQYGKITICTNGTLINQDIITYCKINKINVAINMDGDFKLVASNKFFTKTDWAKLIDNIRMLYLEKIPFDFSTTITPYFIKNFISQVKFLESLHPRMIGFNFLRDTQAQKEFGIINPDNYLQDATSLVFKYNSGKNFNRNKKLKAFRERKQISDCICSGMGITILANGEYTTCGIFQSQRCKNPREVVGIMKENYKKLFFDIDLEQEIKDSPTFGGGCSKLLREDNKRFSYYNALASLNQFNYEKL